MRDLVLVNQVAQGIRPLADARRWFEQLGAAERRAALERVAHVVLQAGAVAGDARAAAERGGVKEGAPACVLWRSGVPKVQIAKVLQLPPEEWARSLTFLLGLLGVADARRRHQRCVGGCAHWWHRDLSDPVVLAELVAVHPDRG